MREEVSLEWKEIKALPSVLEMIDNFFSQKISSLNNSGICNSDSPFLAKRLSHMNNEQRRKKGANARFVIGKRERNGTEQIRFRACTMAFIIPQSSAIEWT